MKKAMDEEYRLCQNMYKIFRHWYKSLCFKINIFKLTKYRNV